MPKMSVTDMRNNPFLRETTSHKSSVITSFEGSPYFMDASPMGTDYGTNSPSHIGREKSINDE
jgi:hypothetical protein